MIAKIVRKLTTFAVDHPKLILIIAIILTIIAVSQFPRVKIDTDPENMLPSDHPDRVYYNKVKEDFGIHDFIVLGITDKEGIFRPSTLGQVHRITNRILEIKGVIIDDVISLVTTDNIKAKDGVLDVRPPLSEIPANQSEADEIRLAVSGNPFLNEKIVSSDGKATAIYIAIERKDQSYRIAQEVENIVKSELTTGQNYYLAGLPIAEDTFGNEMFIQMGIVAPLAFMFILMILFIQFRRLSFLFPPAMDAMFSVLWTMGLLIGTGFTVHIMSSMIPIFLMPMALLSDIHILSEFADRYVKSSHRRQALLEGMEELYSACFYTSATTAAAFASTALADIPPVRVFGFFVAFGVMAAWLLSMTLVPALIMLFPQGTLDRLKIRMTQKGYFIDKFLSALGNFAFRRTGIILVSFLIILGLGVYGLYQVEINDNPVKWFKERHPMRLADKIMNQAFGGTYMAYLVVDSPQAEGIKKPEAMKYIDKLQAYLTDHPLVGKTTSITDVIKRVNFVLHNEDAKYDTIPDNEEAVGQFLFLAQSSGDPTELDNLLEGESRRANIWVQLKSGDNKDMNQVEKLVLDYTKTHPLPPDLTLHWSGLTYINKVWQGVMVWGMLKAVLSSFIWVFLLMLIEFRSFILAFLGILPVSFSILFSYGLLGLVGKNYDMPVAVCGALALGLGIDFAIHFIERFTQRYRLSQGNLEVCNQRYFQEPARANFRMALVIILGFMPLLFSSLTPYVTVGLFFAILMTITALVTLLLLPALMRILGKWALRNYEKGG